ncbi:MAG: 50S ribosomal protein L10 [Firmicutes bacterium]|jgi:large subunit ribosomal protein L10|nr:50S ribosomal protein L10 [Bacillota bacterium]
MDKIAAKQVVVDEIKGKLEKAQGVVLVSSRGLTVAQDTEMRKAMREAGVEFKVYKNTMINFAIKDSAYEPLAEQLEGPTAVAFSYDDATSAARVLDKYVAQYEPLTYKAGVIEGRYYNAEDMVKIGKIPSKEVLLSRLLGSFKSPMSSFARVIKEIAKKNGGEGDAPAEEAAPAPAAE